MRLRNVGAAGGCMTENARDPAAAILRRMEDAWNAADGAGFGAAFAEDADFIDIRGDHHRGRAAIAHGHQAILDTIYRGSTNRYELIDARPLGDAVLVALARATLRVPGGPLAG